MIESPSVYANQATGAARPTRVLVFNVDDALFGIHIDWVEAMYPCTAVEVHAIRNREGRPREFLLHGGEPAAVVDLRDAFDLTAVLGRTVRADYLIVRSPSLLLALPVDACVGIRELDLEDAPPVPSSLLRDGGFPVGHLTAVDGKPIAVLDPGHLLEARERDALAALMLEARAFQEREVRIEALWEALRERPSEADLSALTRLARRNRHLRTAAAARVVLRHLRGDVDEGEVLPQERLLREIVCLWREKATGEVLVPQTDGADESRILIGGGDVVETHHRGDRGRLAFQKVLAAAPEHFYFVEGASEPQTRAIPESTIALIVGSLEALGDRGRR